MLPSVIIDIQCYTNNRNELIPREVSILEFTGKILYHRLARISESTLGEPLTQAKRKDNHWVMTHHHGLGWEGDISYDVMIREVRSILADRTCIYVKGLQKKTFVLENLLCSTRSCFEEVDPSKKPAVSDLGDLKCESLSRLKDNLSDLVISCASNCGYHDSTTHQCAFINCILLGQWLSQTINFVFRPPTRADYQRFRKRNPDCHCESDE